MVIGCRSLDFQFSLQGSAVPVVSEYRYLGVVFQSFRKWKLQTDSLLVRRTRKFHESVAWAENRHLNTGFRRSLFQAYVLPAMQHGAAFLDDASVRRLDKQLRQWGRRLLGWPAGAPGAAVLGELGWFPFTADVKKAQANLFGRFCSADPHGAHRSLAGRVFRYALNCPTSWAQQVRGILCASDIPLPDAFGVGPGCMNRSLEQWKQRCVRPALERIGWQMRRGEVDQLPSLSLFSQCHLDLRFCPGTHCSRLPGCVIREWTLARCGLVLFVSHVDTDRWTVVSCPMFLRWKNAWSCHLQSLGHAVDHCVSCSLQMVFGMEVGGRWAPEAATFTC